LIDVTAVHAAVKVSVEGVKLPAPVPPRCVTQLSTWKPKLLRKYTKMRHFQR